MTEDVVNHPSHYNQYQGFEVIDVCEQLRAPDGTGNYNRGNAFKYLARAGWKSPDKHLEDLRKAEFYIKREIERIENPQNIDTTNTHTSSGPRCPECNTELMPAPHAFSNGTKYYYCPKGHEPVLLPVNATNSVVESGPRCLDCGVEMIPSPKQPNDGTMYFDCPNDDGTLRVPANTYKPFAGGEVTLTPAVKSPATTECGVDGCIDHPAVQTRDSSRVDNKYQGGIETREESRKRHNVPPVSPRLEAI